MNYLWGENFYETVSKDLKKTLPDVKSFSSRNLRYMNSFYNFYPNALILPQVGAKIENIGIVHQVGAQIAEGIVFSIPWGHNKAILDKCKNDKNKALFFVSKTLENNWSRAVLLNFLDTDLYSRQGKAITNFAQTLPGI